MSYRTAETIHDQRQKYNIEALRLLMEKTVPEFGPYKMIATPSMNSARALYALTLNVYPNFVAEITYTDQIVAENDLDFIPIPIDFGIVGYRICFVNPLKKNVIANAKNLTELKNFNVAQGLGWPDIPILQQNGFQVTTVNNYDSLFKLVTSGRVDLFCRGVNELPYERKIFNELKNLSYDESFVIYYDLPRFLFFRRGATELKARLELGLKKAMKDGSLRELWMYHFKQSIQFAGLSKRKMYRLENPVIKNLDPQYKKYFIDPLKL